MGPSRECTDLVLNLTLRCPLRCAHCCYRAGGRATETMSREVMEGAIRAAAALGTVRTVHFSGGDPFVLPDLMRRGIRLATGFGLRTAAVTSAWFATTRRRARTTLEPMASAGLGELCVSYDDMHAAYLPAEHLVNTMTAVGELGLEAFVSVVVEPGSRIDAAWVRGLLEPLQGQARIRVYEMAVNTTGRAADLGDADARAGRAAAGGVHRGPCRSVLGTVQVVHA
ncbi:MAG: radical SAM protein, partial [Gemmatimonadetes bacterium]|nr:radical SAM protein [Gemmatimonadota bacterium]